MAPFFAEERRVLHAGRAFCSSVPGAPPLGSIVVHALPDDYGNLPFISSRNPYVELLLPSDPLQREGLTGRDVEFAVYGWSRAPLYSDASIAWPLPDEVFARVEDSRAEIWAQLSRGQQRYDATCSTIAAASTRSASRLFLLLDRLGEPGSKEGDDYKILLNDDGLPKLRISPMYRRMLDQKEPGSEETRNYVKEKLRSALWLLKSVDQRQRTIYKVAESIVRHQRAFLDHGITHLRPLVLRDVANDIGMHESTVSRVVANKYMHTPRGVYELRFFFHSGITTSLGEAIRSVTIKDKIRKMIDEENTVPAPFRLPHRRAPGARTACPWPAAPWRSTARSSASLLPTFAKRSTEGRSRAGRRHGRRWPHEGSSTPAVRRRSQKRDPRPRRSASSGSSRSSCGGTPSAHVDPRRGPGTARSRRSASTPAAARHCRASSSDLASSLATVMDRLIPPGPAPPGQACGRGRGRAGTPATGAAPSRA